MSKIASIEKIELLLDEFNKQTKELEDKKKAIISENATEINKRIQEKINAISEQIKSEAIHEVCGEKITPIEEHIKFNEEKVKLLNSVIFETEEQPQQEELTEEQNNDENVEV